MPKTLPAPPPDPWIAVPRGLCLGWKVVRTSERHTADGFQFAGLGLNVWLAAKKFAKKLNAENLKSKTQKIYGVV
jgi:hypothetical protein